MKVLVLLALIVSALSCGTPTGTCSAWCTISNDDVGSPYAAFIAGHEGCCQCTYIDTTGNPTIGVGYLLEPSRASALAAVGADYNEIVSGQASLSISQISQLFSSSLDTAVSGAQAIFPEFGSLSTNVQMALVDMTYNLGEAGLNQFSTLKSDLAAGNYAGAAAAAQSSLWCSQVGDRCTQDANLLSGAGSDASDNESLFLA